MSVFVQCIYIGLSMMLPAVQYMQWLSFTLFLEKFACLITKNPGSTLPFLLIKVCWSHYKQWHNKLSAYENFLQKLRQRRDSIPTGYLGRQSWHCCYVRHAFVSFVAGRKRSFSHCETMTGTLLRHEPSGGNKLRSKLNRYHFHQFPFCLVSK